MMRRTHNSNHQIINENEEAWTANKNRVSLLKNETLSTTTPRRAFGLIKNQVNTPVTVSVVPVAKCPESSLDDLCSKYTEKNLTPWAPEDTPTIECFPKSYAADDFFGELLADETISLLADVPVINLDELCSKYTEKDLTPWAQEDTPPIEYFPKVCIEDDFCGEFILDETISLFDDMAERFDPARHNSDYIPSDDTEYDIDMNEEDGHLIELEPLEL